MPSRRRSKIWSITPLAAPSISSISMLVWRIAGASRRIPGTVLRQSVRPDEQETRGLPMKNTEVAPTPTSHNASPDLRSWLRRLAATGRLAVARNGVSLIDQLAAVSKRLELERAVMFPRPGGHPMTVVSNLFVNRSWVADSIGVPTRDLLARFQQAVQRPLPWTEVKDAAAQQVIHHD